MKKLYLILSITAIVFYGCKKQENEDPAKTVTYILDPAGINSTVQYETIGGQVTTKYDQIREVTAEDHVYPGRTTYLRMVTPKGFNLPSSYGITIKYNSKVLYTSGVYETDAEGTRTIVVKYQFTEQDFK